MLTTEMGFPVMEERQSILTWIGVVGHEKQAQVWSLEQKLMRRDFWSWLPLESEFFYITHPPLWNKNSRDHHMLWQAVSHVTSRTTCIFLMHILTFKSNQVQFNAGVCGSPQELLIHMKTAWKKEVWMRLQQQAKESPDRIFNLLVI